MIGAQLREIRQKLGVTLEEVGEKAGGYTRGYLSDLETRLDGQATLPQDAEAKIKSALKSIARKVDQEVREAILTLLEEVI